MHLLLVPAFIVIVMLVFGIAAGVSDNRSSPKPMVPEPEGPAPEHSCLVKGILKSLVEEPEWWEIVGNPGLYSSTVYASHAWSGTTVSCCERQDARIVDGDIVWTLKHSADVENRPITQSEAQALYLAVRTLQAARSQLVRLEAQRKSHAKLERFEALGCPKGEAT